MNSYTKLSYKDIAAEVTLSSQVSNMSYAYPMQEYYRRIQQKSDGQTLLVTIPTEFAQAIPLQKADTVKMTLKNRSIVVSRAD